MYASQYFFGNYENISINGDAEAAVHWPVPASFAARVKSWHAKYQWRRWHARELFWRRREA